MRILFEFIISICIFIYGIQLFSNSLENNYQISIKNTLEKYTNTSFKGILLGTILACLTGSSSIIMVTTIGLVNSNLLTFHSSLGIMMGANLGTCITSWLTAIFNLENNHLSILNMKTYIPFLLLIGLILYIKKKREKSNFLIGFGFFLLGLNMIQSSLTPIMNYTWFKNLLLYFKNPFIGLLTGIIVTSLVQSSSATVAIFQMISEKNTLTYQMIIPIIMGENIGSCFTTLISCINTKKSAKKVALSHLFYNIIGSIIFFLIYYFISKFNLSFLSQETNSFSIALIHTLFNLFSIFIFYPFLKQFEKFINKLT